MRKSKMVEGRRKRKIGGGTRTVVIKLELEHDGAVHKAIVNAIARAWFGARRLAGSSVKTQ